MKKYIVYSGLMSILIFRCFANDKTPYELRMQYGTNYYVVTVNSGDISGSPRWTGDTNSLPTSRVVAESNAVSYAKSNLKDSDAWKIEKRLLKPLDSYNWVYIFLLSPPEARSPSPSGFVPPVLVAVRLNGGVIPAVLVAHPDVSRWLEEPDISDAIEIRVE